MAANKENLRGKSKIPIPQHPLPPLPKYLTENRGEVREGGLRLPLRTLGSQNDQNASSYQARELRNVSTRPGTSKAYANKLPIDTKFVTFRSQENQSLDWGLEVFNDTPKDLEQKDVLNDAIIIDKNATEDSITASEEPKRHIFTSNFVTFRTKDGQNLVKDSPKDFEQKDILNEAIIYNDPKENSIIAAGGPMQHITPASKILLLEPQRVKNLKKSLKRPHSRELQGLSPLAKEKKRLEDEKRRGQSNSNNRGSQLNGGFQVPDKATIQLTKCLIEYEADVFNHLLKWEKRASLKQFIAKSSRACVVNWLMKANGPNGNPAILQTACWYLDSILAQTKTPVRKLQLQGSACFWIAQKIHGTGVRAKTLVAISNNAFTECQLLDAERNILNLLGFPNTPIVPQDFISYFAWICDIESSVKIEQAATFFALSGLLFNTDYCTEYPSVVAAAAVKNACVCLKRESLIETKLEKCSAYKLAVEKAINFENTIKAQRIAVKTVGSEGFAYCTPYKHFGLPPMNLAQKILKAVNTQSATGASGSFNCVYVFG